MSILTILTNVEPLSVFNQNQVREKTGARPTTFSSPALVRQSQPALKRNKDFRVLHLASELREGLLDCTLSVESLTENPRYEALSYVWGPFTQDHRMLCNGVEISITDNLHAALEHIREAKKPRTLWIDAVCINQADVIEKNHQVYMMRDIYRKAQQISIWLGQERDDTAQAWAFFDVLEPGFNSRFERHERDFNDTSEWLGPNLNPLGKDLPPREAPIWGATQALLESPWFSRIWTYQEIIVAAKAVVHCGSHEVQWERFVKLIGWIHTCGHSKSVNYFDQNPLLTWDAQTVYKNKNTSLSSLRTLSTALIRTRNGDATDSRDKIYALFGLLPEDSGVTIGQQFYPDYSLSSRDTYIAIAKWCLIGEQDLMILNAARPRREGTNLPSWVPDWECKNHDSLLVGRRSDGFRSFKASGTSRSFSKVGPADSIDTLHLRGTIICTIAELSDPTDTIVLSNLGEGKWLPSVSHYDRIATQLGLPEKYRGQPARVTYARTLAAGLGMGMFEKDDAHLCIGTRQSYWSANLVWKKQGFPQPPPPPVLHEVGLHTLKMIQGKKFFTSSEHTFMGLCPDSTHVGDIVCILLGGEVPYVLRAFGGTKVRKVDGQVTVVGQHFELVGEAYVDGIMDGELESWIAKAPFDFILH